MRISELIEELQEAMEHYGDINTTCAGVDVRKVGQHKDENGTMRADYEVEV